ncbi:hypothetical protein ES288_D09G095800v1 [Gossypium darwinii]|uniref:30S ribosomal protein S2, chloroplastic n=1 Tax=Gossypium darwinii TaxID=34276 RepID=A0A5D2BCN1_GOSDA|nr:hypothetical protein ES288_D09G095800v1 [Gossypium darwinii]
MGMKFTRLGQTLAGLCQARRIYGSSTICLIDTNSDLGLADISIPANDDAIASIQLILNKLVVAICEGRPSYIRNP